MNVPYLTTAADPVEALVLCSPAELSESSGINRIMTFLVQDISAHSTRDLRSDVMSKSVNHRYQTIGLSNPHSSRYFGQT